MGDRRLGSKHRRQRIPLASMGPRVVRRFDFRRKLLARDGNWLVHYFFLLRIPVKFLAAPI